MPPTAGGSDFDPSVLRDLLVDQVRNGVIVTDLEGTVVFWNRFATELFGWTADEALGSNIAELTVGPAEADLGAEIMEAVASGGTWSGEFRTSRKDGSTFLAHVTNTLLRDAAGTPVGVVGVSTDITPLRAAEEEARRQGDLAQAVLAAIPTQAVVLDASGSIVAFNQAWIDFAGRNGAADGSVDQGVDYLAVCRSDTDSEVASRIAAAIERICQAGGSWSTEYPCTVEDDVTWFACEVVGLPGGGCVVMHRDITAAVEERETLRRLALEKDRFVTTVSHEVRTPLTAVLGLAEELTTSTDLTPEQIHEFHQIIAEQAREVSSLVEDLLVIARIDNNTLTVVPESIDVGAVIASVLRPFLITNGPIEFDASDRPVQALGDGARLRQVIRNLVNNAVRHGAPPIGISIVPSHERVEIVVYDHGRGIPPEHVDLVFQPGTRSASEDPDSVGIGLSVAKALVERMGGSLRYHRNARTEFIVSLPAGH